MIKIILILLVVSILFFILYTSQNKLEKFNEEKKCEEITSEDECTSNKKCVYDGSKCKDSEYELVGTVSKDFKNMWMKNQFVINAIPEDKKITIVWEEDMDDKDIDKYILYIYQDNNIGEVYAHTIEKNKIIKNQDKYIYTVDGLLNNIQYGVQLNKISVAKEVRSLVKTSNTIYVVPSQVSIFDFSKLQKCNEDSTSFSENIHDLLKGKQFQIELN